MMMMILEETFRKYFDNALPVFKDNKELYELSKFVFYSAVLLTIAIIAEGHDKKDLAAEAVKYITYSESKSKNPGRKK